MRPRTHGVTLDNTHQESPMLKQKQAVIFAKESDFSDYLIEYMSKQNWVLNRLSLQELSQAQVSCMDRALGQRVDIITNTCVISGNTIKALIWIDNDCSKIKRVTETQDYIESGLLAQLLALFSIVRVTINPLNHEMLCPGYFYIPRLYQLMQQCGLQTPAWYFSSDEKQSTQSKTQSIRTFQKPYDLTNKHQQKHSHIDKHEGEWSFCLHVMGALYFDSEMRTQHPTVYWQKKIINFCQQIRLDLGEILIMNHNQHWLVYAISRQPDWDVRWRRCWPMVASRIANKLSKDTLLPKPRRQKTFIKISDLPLYQGAGSSYTGDK